MSETVIDRVRLVLQAATETNGMTKAAFAQKINLTSDKLSKSLSGVRRFTTLDLALIAEATGVTVDWLLTGRQPMRPAVAARTHAPETPLDPTEVHTLTAPTSRAYEVLELLGRLPELPELPSPQRDLGRYVDQGEALADAALERLGAAGHASLAALDFSELVTAVEAVFGVDVLVTRLPDGLSGLAWQTDAFRLVLLNPSEAWTRQRFTLAHELGHVLARDAQELIPEQQVAPGRQSDWTEVRANAFAAALLMPKAELAAALEPLTPASSGTPTNAQLSEVVARFKVSPSALAARTNKLRLLDSATRARLRGLRTELAHFLAGTVETSERERQLSATLKPFAPRPAFALFSAYADGDTTLRPLAALLGRSVDELHDILDPVLDEPAGVGAEDGDLVYQP